MTAIATALTDLRRTRPEWQPWLSVVEEAVRETGAAHWDRAVPRTVQARPGVPLLAGATVAVSQASTRRLLDRLLRVASRSGTSPMATLRAAADADLDVLPLFAASLSQEGVRVEEIGASAGVDPGAFHAVVALLAVPFLQACHHQWAASLPPAWMEGFCPLCASLPAFAEVRGIERTRYFRCGRCGSGWQAHALHCPFCSNRDHDELATLVPDAAGGAAAIEACRRCRGYVKTFNRLQGCDPEMVMIEDLASVDLDVAALEQGYARRPGAGCALDVTVAAQPAWRFFGGNV